MSSTGHAVGIGTPPSLADRVAPKPVARKHADPLLIGLGLYSVGWLIATAVLRGPWVDEFWTLWASLSHLHLSEIFWQRWIVDVHPPLYYFGNWLASGVVGDTMTARRLLNLVPLAAVILYGAIIARKVPGTSRFLALFAVVLVSLPSVVIYFSDARSNFLQACASACIAMALYAGEKLGRDLDWRQDAWLILLLLLATTAGLNAHFISTFINVFVIGCFGLGALIGGRRRTFWMLLAVGVVASLPLAAFLIWQTATLIGASTVVFWINTPPLVGLRIILKETFWATFGNVVAGASALLALSLLLKDRGLSRHRDAAASPLLWGFLLPAGIGTALASILLVALSFIRPIIVDRYLVSAVVFVASLVAALAADLVMGSRLGRALVVANAALTMSWHGFALVKQHRWDETAAIVARQKASCPSSRVLAIEPQAVDFQNVSDVYAFAYGYEARRFGFDFAYSDQTMARPVDTGGACPTIVWAENINPGVVPTLTAPQAARDLRLQVDGPALDRAVIERGDSGIVMTFRR